MTDKCQNAKTFSRKTWVEMAKDSNDIRVYVTHVMEHTGKTHKTSKNNETGHKLSSCSIKTRLLKLPREQIHNKLSRITVIPLVNLKVYS